MLFMNVFMMFFPTGVFLCQTLEAGSLKTFEQHDGAPFLIPFGKHFKGD